MTFARARLNVTTLDEQLRLGQRGANLGAALATGPSPQQLFAGLTVDDQNTMMSGEDPYFASWGPRVDTVAPSPVEVISVDYVTPSDRQAEIS